MEEENGRGEKKRKEVPSYQRFRLYEAALSRLFLVGAPGRAVFWFVIIALVEVSLVEVVVEPFVIGLTFVFMVCIILVGFTVFIPVMFWIVFVVPFRCLVVPVLGKRNDGQEGIRCESGSGYKHR
jgi:hypothetical protein